MTHIIKASGDSLSLYNGYTLPTETIRVKREKTISRLPEDHKEAVKVAKILKHSRDNIKVLLYKKAKIERELLYNNMLTFITCVLSCKGITKINGFKVTVSKQAELSNQQVNMLES